MMKYNVMILTMMLALTALKANSTTICIHETDTVASINTADSINPSIRNIIHEEDFEKLATGKHEALNILLHLDSDAYGKNETAMVRNLLMKKEQNISKQELTSYHKVRSIQVNRLGIFSYPYFTCRFRIYNDKMFFEKTSGSQRKSGYVYRNTPQSMVFLGGWSVNNDPQTSYGSINSEAGMLYKIGTNKLIMLFVNPGERFEIYEFIK